MFSEDAQFPRKARFSSCENQTLFSSQNKIVLLYREIYIFIKGRERYFQSEAGTDLVGYIHGHGYISDPYMWSLYIRKNRIHVL